MVALASVAAVLAPRARDVRAPGPRTARVVCCSAQPAASRRAVLAAPALLLAASSLPARALNAQGEYEITELPKPYQAAQVAEYRKLLLSTLKEKAVSLDYRKLVRLLFNDAAGGGRDGSVHFSEEMSRPENAGLADTVKALAAIKATVDQASKTPCPLSWTDLIGWAAQVSTREAFRAELRRAINKELIPPGLGNDFPLPRLGGADAPSPSAPGGVPSASAGVAEWKATFARLGLRPIDLALLGPDIIGDDPVKAEALLMQDPEIAGMLADLVPSKAQVGRTSYEVKYAKAFLAVANVGFKVDPLAYLYPEKRVVTRL